MTAFGCCVFVFFNRKAAADVKISCELQSDNSFAKYGIILSFMTKGKIRPGPYEQ